MMTVKEKAERREERIALRVQFAESAKRQEAAKAEFRAHVARGTCPVCGAKLQRNLSLAGWWQCEQLGAANFRKDASKPSCNFQGFTE